MPKYLMILPTSLLCSDFHVAMNRELRQNGLQPEYEIRVPYVRQVCKRNAIPYKEEMCILNAGKKTGSFVKNVLEGYGCSIVSEVD